MIDVLILTTEKDYNKLKFAYDSILMCIKNIHEVFCISPSEIPIHYLPSNVYTFLDREVIDFDFSLIQMKERRGWYRQQFIKLFQEVTLENYFVVDSDVWINKKITIDENNPAFFIGRDQLHQPYFDLMKELLNLDRVYSHSFISEMMFFKREIIREILDNIKVDEYKFFERCVRVINQTGDFSGFSEYELYGNFVTKHHPNLYKYIPINVLHRSKKRIWTDDEILRYITTHEREDYDILTMHTYL